LQDLSIVLNDSTLLAELNHHPSIPDLNVSSLNATMRCKGGVDTATLANNWGIGIEAAKRTHLLTTQREIRKMIHPSLKKRRAKNDRQLQYRRRPVTIFTDTMYSKIFSRQGNKAAQVFCTEFGCVRDFPMNQESEAYEVISLIIHIYGVTNVMVMDGANTKVEGEFRRKLRDVVCHIKQTGPHTQTSNMGEGAVRKLKRRVGRKMICDACNKQLWDDCIIREAYVRSHTHIDIFGLEGQVPDSKLKGETVDIYVIAEYAWYEWLKFRYTAAKFPVSKIQLGRDLGAAIDIGLAMAKYSEEKWASNVQDIF
jgi:hypothetical protein